jgi:hypothetical protein
MSYIINKRFFQKHPKLTFLLVLLTVIIVLSTATLLINYFRICVFNYTNREGATPNNNVYLTVTLTNNTIGISDPNPNGLYTVSLGSSSPTDISLNETIKLPYLDSGSSLSLTVKPKSSGAINKPHYADVFPKQYRLDMTFDNSGSTIWSVNSTNNSIIYIKGNTLNVDQLGIVKDANNNTIAYVKNDTSNQKHWMIDINEQVDISSIVFNWKPMQKTGTYPAIQ